jgi:hypothetical protein
VVTSDTRNNLIIVIVLMAMALMVTVLISNFIANMERVTKHGEKTVDEMGTNLINNVTQATNRSSNNSKMIVSALNNVSKNNNASITVLANILDNFSTTSRANLEEVNNNSQTNKIINQQNLKQNQRTNLLLGNVTKQLSILPVTPIPYNPQNKTCNLYSIGFPFCILPSNHPIFDLLGNKTQHNITTTHTEDK